MSEIVIRLDIQVDPTLTDPHEVADYLLALYDEDRKAGNAPFTLAETFLEAEWA